MSIRKMSGTEYERVLDAYDILVKVNPDDPMLFELVMAAFQALDKAIILQETED